MKKKYKEEGNTAFLTLTKLMMNAVTGKFGQRPNFENRVVFNDHDECTMIRFDIEKKRKVGKVVKLKDSNDESFYVAKKYVDVSPEENLERIHNFLIVSFITMRTRVKLYSFIKKVGIPNWLYSDTDSLKVVKELDDKSLVGPELGQFKDEGHTLQSMFYHPKAYYWQDHFTFGGVDLKKTVGLNYKEIEEGYVIQEGKKSIINVKDGVEISASDYVVGVD